MQKWPLIVHRLEKFFLFHYRKWLDGFSILHFSTEKCTEKYYPAQEWLLEPKASVAYKVCVLIMVVGANYFQSVTEKLAMGAEFFWMHEQRRSGIGFAARHVGSKHVGTLQMANTGVLALSYLHKIGEKVIPKSVWTACVDSDPALENIGHSIRHPELWSIS